MFCRSHICMQENKSATFTLWSNLVNKAVDGLKDYFIFSLFLKTKHLFFLNMPLMKRSWGFSHSFQHCQKFSWTGHLVVIGGTAA